MGWPMVSNEAWNKRKEEEGQQTRIIVSTQVIGGGGREESLFSTSFSSSAVLPNFFSMCQMCDFYWFPQNFNAIRPPCYLPPQKDGSKNNIALNHHSSHLCISCTKNATLATLLLLLPSPEAQSSSVCKHNYGNTRPQPSMCTHTHTHVPSLHVWIHPWGEWGRGGGRHTTNQTLLWD